MTKMTLRTGLFLALALGTPTALAEPFATKGEFVFSGERLFGISYAHVAEQQDDSDSSTQFSFLGQNPTVPVAGPGIAGANIGLAAMNPYSLPKLGFDYLVTDGLTIGGSLIYAHTSNTATRTVARGITNTADSSGDSFVFLARVGYAYMFSDAIGIWPRGGFMYHYQAFKDDSSGDKVSLDGFALALDCPFVFSPVEHFAFTVGPAVDIGLSGSVKASAPGLPSVSSDAVLTGFGVYAGVMGWI